MPKFDLQNILIVIAMMFAGSATAAPANQVANYNVTADFRNVQGLRVGSEVSSAGVVVGRVARIELLNENKPDGTVLFASDQARVTLSIERKYKFPADIEARVLMVNFEGGKYVDLNGGGSQDDVLAVGSRIANTTSAVVFEDALSAFLAVSQRIAE